MNDFNQLNLDESLSRALEQMKISVPTPIQAKSLTQTLEGKDLVGCAQTGTGKSLAFCLPLLTHMLKVRKRNALILAPTRELAIQIKGVIRELTQFCPQLKSVLLIGGEPINRQIREIASRPRPQILVATPGRMIDHLDRGTINPRLIDFLVLDEADQMMDMGFAPQLKEIADRIPKKRQTLMFSATMPPEMEKLANRFLTDPIRVSAGERSKPVAKIRQSTVHVTQENKRDILLDELNKREGSIIIFVSSKHRTDRVTRFLKDYGHKVIQIHGDRSQRQRREAITGFRNGKFRILAATDIAARGLDIPAIGHVLNYDLPRAVDDYVHRVGRTARAGADGEAVAFLLPEDRLQWTRISRKFGLPPLPGDKMIKGTDKKSRPKRPSRSKPKRKSNSEPREFSRDSFKESRRKPRKSFTNGKSDERSARPEKRKKPWEKRGPRAEAKSHRGNTAGKPTRPRVSKKPAENDASDRAPSTPGLKFEVRGRQSLENSAPKRSSRTQGEKSDSSTPSRFKKPSGHKKSYKKNSKPQRKFGNKRA